MESSERTTYQHYEVERHPDGSLHELGRGAMGITYKALDSNLRVPVALKVITGALLPDARARSRFLREARAAAQLRHSNVATVYHLGQEADFCFYTMEFIDGETCEARVRREGPLDHVTALRVCSQVARALQAAHARGLLHRDLKPSNLMVSQEGGDLLVKVIDFGLVKPLQQDDAEAGASLSGGLFLGTPLYASPEQCASEETLDGRSDLYSLGATLWFLLSGEPLFKGSMRSVMAQHLTKPPPVEGLHGQPPAVMGLLRELLAKDPSDRPADAGTLRTRIAEVLRELEADKAAPAPGAAALARSTPAAPAASFTLDDVLRKRGGLPPGEVLFLLPRLAALLEGTIPGQPLPDLAPRNVHGHFTLHNTVADLSPLLSLPPQEWPPFTLGIDALLPTTTVVLAPSDGTLLQVPQSTPTTPVESLGCLVYELLNGSPLAVGRPYRPLTILTEAGNNALRAALPFGQPTAYAGIKDFCAALTRGFEGSSTTAIPGNIPSPTAHNTVASVVETLPPPLPVALLGFERPKGQINPVQLSPRQPLPPWLIPVGAVVALLVAGAGLFTVWQALSHRGGENTAVVSPAASSARDSQPSSLAPSPPVPASSVGPPATATPPPRMVAAKPEPPPVTPPQPDAVSARPEPPAVLSAMPTVSTMQIDSDSVANASGTRISRTPVRPPSRRQPPEPSSSEPIKPTRKSATVASAETSSGKGSQEKSSLLDKQKKALALQHKNGALSDSDYQQALKGLGK